MLYIFEILRERAAGIGSSDDRGATAVEYGLMVALIAVAIITTVGLLGVELNEMFAFITTKLAAITPA